MNTIIVLAMHGAPPNDLPRNEINELFGLHARLERASASERAALEKRHDELESKIRAWPRTRENDPFHVGSMELASELSCATRMEVVVGYNEFCAPSLDEAFDLAANGRVERVIVVTPMMTRGGEHSELDIPAAIERARDLIRGSRWTMYGLSILHRLRDSLPVKSGNIAKRRYSMVHKQVEKEVAQKSAWVYIPISLGAALLFLIITTRIGNYTLVARFGGTVWVGLLSLIVSMPIAISRVKKQLQNR